MRAWTPERIAQAAGARLIAPPPAPIGSARDPGPERVVIDSREAGPGALFVGLEGANTDGGRFSAQALAAGAWGVLVRPDHAEGSRCAQPGVLLASDDPLRSLQRLAKAWRRGLGAEVIGVTGSTGKTSTKELLLALLAPHRRTVASRANYNTEIGVPLEILGAPAGTEVLVLEMAMRGKGQIAELAEIAQPNVGVIVNIGPAHLELLGTIEAIAAAKAELIGGLIPGGTAIIPANEPLLVPHLRREDLRVVTFGDGGDVRLVSSTRERVEIELGGESLELEVSFPQVHLRRNLLAAVAAARAVGVRPEGRVAYELSPGRGLRQALPDSVTLIDDCYNANPMSMRAALDDLAVTPDSSRRVAVLGEMLELGPDEHAFHAEVGEQAARAGVDVLVTVGSLAASMRERFDGEAHSCADATEAAALVPELVRPGDAVLVKGSRGVGLELVCRALAGRSPASTGAARR